MVGFPRTHQRSLSTPKDIKFEGLEIIVPPLPMLPISSTPPTENAPVEGQNPLVPSDASDRASLAPPSIISDGDVPLISSDYARLLPVFDHETPAADEFPDNPSVCSATPQNSSTPPTTDPPRGSMRWSLLANVNFGDVKFNVARHHPSVERFSGVSNERPAGVRSYDEDGSTPMSKGDSRGRSHCLDWWFACV